MNFRTEIGHITGGFEISLNDKIALVGSCFADNIGGRLERDGFTAVHNPLGPLFNPGSVERLLRRGLRPYVSDELIEYDGVWHCLDFANRYQSTDRDALLERVNTEYMAYAQAIAEADVLIITLGTTNAFTLNGEIVGNCHKLPGYMFDKRQVSIDEIGRLAPFLQNRRSMLTLSPVRYPGEGLAKGFMSKAMLRVGIEDVCRTSGCDYFPTYEILNDDLRDYRFYAPDMRHPSETAVDYIYDKFAETYFSADTLRRTLENRRVSLTAAHRQIIIEQ